MSLLSGLATSEEIVESGDSVGGGGPLESGIYDCTVTMAYLQESKGGALGLHLTLDAGGREVRQTLWMTSGTAKGKKTFYVNKQGEKRYLPGFELASALALMTTGSEIAELATEDKIVKIYSPEAKAEVPTQVPVITAMLGQAVKAGIQKQTVDRTAKNDQTGNYEPTGETREVNEIDKFFHGETGLTVVEAKAGATEATFINTWRTKWDGVTRDRSTKVDAPAAGARTFGGPAAAGAAPATPKPTSLFGG